MLLSISFLNDFIAQAESGSHKTSQYPREFQNLKMKVSFGIGKPARVPWISLTAAGMTTSNGYFPVYLYYKEQKTLILSFGISETQEFGSNWPKNILENYARIETVIEKPVRYGNSLVFKKYEVFRDKNLTKFQIDGSDQSSEEMEKDLNEILKIYEQSLDQEVNDESSTISTGLFYMEKQLEDFIIENWENTKLGEELELIYERSLVSQQYWTDIGPIDILAKRKKGGNHVVIELKKNQNSDQTVGQIARYMGWIKEKLNDENVSGIIIAGKFDEKLDFARKMVSQLEVFIYEVQFELREYRKS